MERIINLKPGEEIVKPDLEKAYIRLIPLVTAATVHLMHGDSVQAQKCLDSAQEVIYAASQTVFFMPLEKDNWDESGGLR